MDKTLLVITEHFTSDTQEEQGANLQQAVDRYLFLVLNHHITPPAQGVDGP